MVKPLIVLVLLAAGAVAVASVPVGVYGIVDKVVLEPAGVPAERAQIWGTFATWDEGVGLGYRAPQRGYLYYRCSADRLRVCRNEWADLTSIAGTGQTIGFGSRSLLAGRVRPQTERPSGADPYPTQFGVVQLGSSPRGAIFDQLKALARSR